MKYLFLTLIVAIVFSLTTFSQIAITTNTDNGNSWESPYSIKFTNIGTIRRTTYTMESTPYNWYINVDYNYQSGKITTKSYTHMGTIQSYTTNNSNLYIRGYDSNYPKLLLKHSENNYYYLIDQIQGITSYYHLKF